MTSAIGSLALFTRELLDLSCLKKIYFFFTDLEFDRASIASLQNKSTDSEEDFFRLQIHFLKDDEPFALATLSLASMAEDGCPIILRV